MRKQFQFGFSAVFLISSLADTTAHASRGDGVPDEELSRQRAHRQFSSESMLPLTRNGGYIMQGRDGKPVCGQGQNGSNIGLPKCEGENLRIAQAGLRVTGAMARVNQKGEEATGQNRQAGVVAVVGIFAALYCATTGVMEAEADRMQTVIKIADLERKMDNVASVGAATVMGWPAARMIVNRMLPKATGLARFGTTGVVIGGICGVSAGAGYVVYSFFFAGPSDLEAPRRK